MMLPMQQEMQGDEIVVTSRWLHVKTKRWMRYSSRDHRIIPRRKMKGK